MSNVTVGIICLIVGLALGAFVFYLLRKNQSSSDEEVTEVIGQKLTELLPIVLNQANENLVRMANEKLGSETKQNRMDLESKREEITRMVKDLENYVKTAEKERIDSYATLKNSVEESRKVTEKLSVSTENLKELLSDNSVRGQFGEKVADDLLKMAGFVKGVDYEFNRKQDDSKTRPDFAIFLPDRTRINVDSKFPYANLRKMSETDDKGMKQKYMKDFEKDVKEKIKQVTTRDYINPEDKTVDFVILFVPNEMIFSFIYDKMPEITEEAMANRVILAGPFSFTAILRMVKQAYENFRVQKNIYNIIGHVKAFEKEFGNFSDSFFKIGDRIEALQKQYDTVSTTRFNQLTRRMDQVKLEGVTEENNPSPVLYDSEDSQGKLID
ncbi:MAG TPA: DNA recombination protein RmuC [Candidatus Dojkabacteria bacterium]|nr:DNA recombination protein RmuC [Candidatus Dojkabacteria bacterium]